MPVWTHYFAHFVVAVIATISFGITFQMPRRHYLACGLTGAVGWMVYIFGVELFALSPAIATLVATLPLTGCARFFAIRHKAPVTIFLLPGIFPLVPGGGRCPWPRPRTDEGKVCPTSPYTGSTRKVCPHQSPAGDSFPRGGSQKLPGSRGFPGVFFTTNYTSGSARYSLHPAKA